jgi:hypothetical protein
MVNDDDDTPRERRVELTDSVSRRIRTDSSEERDNKIEALQTVTDAIILDVDGLKRRRRIVDRIAVVVIPVIFGILGAIANKMLVSAAIAGETRIRLQYLEDGFRGLTRDMRAHTHNTKATDNE